MFKYEMRRRGKLGQCLDYLVQHLITIIKDPSSAMLATCFTMCATLALCPGELPA